VEETFVLHVHSPATPNLAVKDFSRKGGYTPILFFRPDHVSMAEKYERSEAAVTFKDCVEVGTPRSVGKNRIGDSCLVEKPVKKLRRDLLVPRRVRSVDAKVFPE
jgi:hypothetical protein